MKTQLSTSVKTFITHTRAHQDELCALWLFFNFGSRIFRDVDKADVKFIRKDWGRYPKDVVLVGIGYGEFDEHRPEGRLSNTCAAMLVARRLKLTERFGELLGEVLWCDTNAGVKPTQLANLIKSKHRVNHGDNQYDTMRWSFLAFDAIAFGTMDPAFDIRSEWDAFACREERSKNKDALLRVKRLIIGAHERKDGAVTELASIAGRMDKAIRAEWLAKAFRILIRDAEMFAEAVDEINKKSQFFDINTKKGLQPLCVVVTDNEHATAAFSQKTGLASVLIVRNSAGHTCVMSNPHVGLPILHLAGLIRMAEYKAQTGLALEFKRARGQGTMEECPQWHLANEKVLLNGSLTHPDVSPSKLSLDELVKIVRVAYDDNTLQSWLVEYESDSPVSARELVEASFS